MLKTSCYTLQWSIGRRRGGIIATRLHKQPEKGAGEDGASALEIAVTVTPPQSVLPGGVPVVMGYRLG